MQRRKYKQWDGTRAAEKRQRRAKERKSRGTTVRGEDSAAKKEKKGWQRQRQKAKAKGTVGKKERKKERQGERTTQEEAQGLGLDQMGGG